MKVIRIELFVLDFENQGESAITDEIENIRNLHVKVIVSDSREIGDWDDSNPLNHARTCKEEFERLFDK